MKRTAAYMTFFGLMVPCLLACGQARAGADPSAAVFSPDRILEVSIQMRPDDFEKLRRQTRSNEQITTTLRERRRPRRIFTYFSASIRLAGKTLGRVGVRKKGFWGSLSTEKPSLKIKFSKYVSNLRPFGLRRLTLNNALQDPAYIGQCLVYRLFTKSGLAAPRCNFARVRVNGKDLGLYVNVESIDRSSLARRFKTADGNLFEGNMSDLRAGWMGSFVRKTNKRRGSSADLWRLASAVQRPEKDLLAALDKLLDLDAFYNYWALEALVAQTDSYPYNGNNFYLYDDPTSGRFYFIPWGADQVMPELPAGAGTVYAMSALLPVRLLAIDAARERYERTLRKLLAGVWNEQELLGRVDLMAKRIEPLVPRAKLAAFKEATEHMRRFIRGRRRVVLAEIERRAHPQLARDIGISRSVLIFAPYTTGSTEKLCAMLRSQSGKPFRVTELVVRSPALRAEAVAAPGGVQLCVELFARPERPKRLIRIHTDRADQKVMLLPVTLLRPLDVSSKSYATGK